ncbi:MAG TPA: ABC transporter permease [Vicinamibacterales bacterium]|nr:ABC transporter permease [Vicinamibacterales bacterium]
MHPLSRLVPDLRYGIRTLRQSPGFTLVAVATLALALGANTAIFSFVNAVLLKPLPYAEPDRIVRVLEAPPGGGRNGISTLNFLDWQKENKCFDFMAARSGGSVALTGVDQPVQIPGSRVSAHFFDIFGVKAALGRTFVEGEDQAGHDHVVVLNHSLWQTQFGGDPAIVGRKIQLDGEPYTVVGVLPRGTPFERDYARLWRPLTFQPDNMTRNFHWFGAFARLKQGVTLEQARAQMDTIGRRIAHDFPDSNKDWGVGVDRLSDTIVDPQLGRSLYVLLSAVGMVLLIACANLANLSLMRVVAREREIAIRTALGASRWALLRQFLTESLLVSLAGGALGLVVGQLAMSGLKAVMPSYALPSEAEVALDWRVLLFSFLLAVLTGAIVGFFPAMQAARPNLSNSLKQGGVGTSVGSGHSRVRSTLVVVEIALAFVLLSGAGLLIRSLDKLGGVDPGFDSRNVLTFNLPVSQERFPDPAALDVYLHQVTGRLETLPGVTDVALTSARPMQGWGYGMPFQIASQKTVDRANRQACFFKMVSASYFHTLRMRMLQGRLLAATDRHGTPPVTVINESMAKKYFKDANPVGQRILVQEIVPGKTQLGDEIPWEVVGVVADEFVGGLDQKPGDNPGIYVTNEQSPVYYLSALVRSSKDTALLREPITNAVHEISRDQTLPDMKTLETIKAESLGDNRFRVLLLGTFAGVSLLLSAIGIYGVISYSVTQRTREIGIRSALGATRGHVLRLILGWGLTLAVIGLGIGIGGSIAVAQLIASLLFGVTGRDPLTLGAVAAVLGLVALLACLLPARRATKVDPLVALRYE